MLQERDTEVRELQSSLDEQSGAHTGELLDVQRTLFEAQRKLKALRAQLDDRDNALAIARNALADRESKIMALDALLAKHKASTEVCMQPFYLHRSLALLDSRV